MFGMGMGEIILIAVVALLVLGPERLPGAAKAIGKGIRDLRSQTKDLQETIEQDTQIGDAVREIRGALRGDPETLYKKATGEDFLPKDDAPGGGKKNEGEGGDKKEGAPKSQLADGADHDYQEEIARQLSADSALAEARRPAPPPPTPAPPPTPNAAEPKAAASPSVIADEFANTDDAWGEVPANPHEDQNADPDLPVIRTPAGSMARGDNPPDADSTSESGDDPRHG